MKILLVASRYPWPPRRGDQMRLLQFLRHLRRASPSAGAEIDLLLPTPGARDRASERGCGARSIAFYRRDTLDRLGGALSLTGAEVPLQTAHYRSRDLRDVLRRRAVGADLVVVQLARLAEHLPLGGGAPVFVDLVDCLSLSFRRRAEVDAPWLRPLLRWEAGRLRRLERSILRRVAGVSVVCERDLRALPDGGPGAASATVVPLPLDFDASAAAGIESGAAPPNPGLARRTPPDRPRVVFTGNLGYFVNRDAAEWFLRWVWPRLRERRSCELVIAGARPSASLRRAIRRAGARLIADPPSLREIVSSATLAVAPLRCGAGVPVKVLEAWADGIPVVASPWATAGVDATDGRELLVAESPAQWVARVESLLDHPQLRSELARGGRRALHERHSEAVAERALGRAIAPIFGRAADAGRPP